MKQGAGGLLHSKKWKRRFFVLFRVPQGHVLVYYARGTVSVDELMGFIDLRQATEVESDVCMIDKQPRKVIEIVTPQRTFVLAPETLNKVSSCAGVQVKASHTSTWRLHCRVSGVRCRVTSGGCCDGGSC